MSKLGWSVLTRVKERDPLASEVSICAFSSIHYYKLLNNEECIILTFSLLGTQSEHQRAFSSFQVVIQLSVPLISYVQY